MLGKTTILGKGCQRHFCSCLVLGCGLVLSRQFRGGFDILSLLVQISSERYVVAQPWCGLHGEASCQMSRV
jgi:hypothetical protein